MQLSTLTSFTTFSTLTLPMWRGGRREWCLKGPPGATHLESKQLLTIGGDLHIYGLCACQSPTAPQISFEAILPCKPETGTEWVYNKASKTGSRDSLCSHRRGTDLLADKALRRLAPAKATGEIRPCCILVIRFHVEVEPTWTTNWWMA